MNTEALGEEVSRMTARFPKFTFGSWAACAYCGAVPGARDHAIAASFITNSDRSINPSLAFHYGPQTPACGQCNSILGNKYFDSFSERASYVSSCIYKKTMRLPVWAKDEIAPLKGRLKKVVINGQNEKAEYQRRAAWFGSTEFCMNLEGFLYEPLLTKTHSSFHSHYYSYFKTTIDLVQHCIHMHVTNTHG